MDISKINKIPQSNVEIEETEYLVTACAGANGCPLTLVNGTEAEMGQKIASIIENSEITEKIAELMPPIRLKHHKLKISIAGCPNACSRPHVADIGIIARARPVLEGQCNGCRVCLRICPDNAIDLNDGFQLTDECIDCGICITPCPINVLDGEKYLEVLVGGKLGRHPHLGKSIAKFEEIEDIYAFIQAAIEVYEEHAKQSERVSHVASRLGIDNFGKKVLEKM